MNLKRTFIRVLYHTCKTCIKAIDIFDPRFAMLLYNRLLIFVGVKINGIPRFISTDIRIDSFNLIEIGDRVVISESVILLTHDYSITTALISINEEPSTDISINRRILIGNNVFIGIGSILLPGTNIGNNVIIGAGTVVRGMIPENSVVIGNPGKVINSLNDYALKYTNYIKLNNGFIHKDNK